jgi:DNA modification methylase
MPAQKPSSLVDTRVVYCGDNLDQLRELPDACVDLIYIDPPFNSNRNYEVFGNGGKSPIIGANEIGGCPEWHEWQDQ